MYLHGQHGGKFNGFYENKLSLETDTLSWWDGLRGLMTLIGYASESLYSWQLKPC